MSQDLLVGLHPDAEYFDKLSTSDSVPFLIRDHGEAYEAVCRATVPIVKSAELIIKNVRAGGSLMLVGAGTSGRLAFQQGAEFPPTFGDDDIVKALLAGGMGAFEHSVEGAEDDEDEARRQLDLLLLSKLDVVCGIAASGTTPFTCAAVEYARDMGCPTVFISGTHLPIDAHGRMLANVTIPLNVGPEIPDGSTRMKAGTAQKIVLDVLTTELGRALGKIFGGLMVDVRATNAKLRKRAIRIVRLLTDLSEEAALQMLQRAGWWVKAAVVMHYKKLSLKEGEDVIGFHQGNLRNIIGDVLYLKKMH